MCIPKRSNKQWKLKWESYSASLICVWHFKFKGEGENMKNFSRVFCESSINILREKKLILLKDPWPLTNDDQWWPSNHPTLFVFQRREWHKMTEVKLGQKDKNTTNENTIHRTQKASRRIQMNWYELLVLISLILKMIYQRLTRTERWKVSKAER